jgi:hypothetical protein
LFVVTLVFFRDFFKRFTHFLKGIVKFAWLSWHPARVSAKALRSSFWRKVFSAKCLVGITRTSRPTILEATDVFRKAIAGLTLGWSRNSGWRIPARLYPRDVGDLFAVRLH